ncbi:hypothetical protein [Sandaracinus amylolyticus]|uniref:hypothetical protein n=1 Tax=Sandaracinus amylolyticus TaxID=927083 RepID=UPI001F33434D|nr:hypothetical protein [Sandaracinus amylolyticus]UJR78905.1 Hypothetical protein I5071_9380 [Sandaracinus amylolyticus]
MTSTTNTERVTCPKCNGARRIIGFMHIEGGKCFTCAGAGWIEVRPEQGRTAPRRNIDWAHRVRQMYRNAKLPSSHPCHLEFAMVTDERDGMGWTDKGLSDVLDLVPGSREAFRALGWPV